MFQPMKGIFIDLKGARSGDTVEYVGPDTELAKTGDRFVVVGYVEGTASLGKLGGGIDKSAIMDNLLCDLDVDRKHYRYFKVVERSR